MLQETGCSSSNPDSNTGDTETQTLWRGQRSSSLTVARRRTVAPRSIGPAVDLIVIQVTSVLSRDSAARLATSSITADHVTRTADLHLWRIARTHAAFALCVTDPFDSSICQTDASALAHSFTCAAPLFLKQTKHHLG